MRAARCPAVGDRIARTPLLDDEWPVPASIRAEEAVAIGVEPGESGRAGEVGEVVSALAVFGRVVDDAAIHLDLADGEVPLQVRRVVPRVPKAELDGAEQRQPGDGVATIGDPRGDLARVTVPR